MKKLRYIIPMGIIGIIVGFLLAMNSEKILGAIAPTQVLETATATSTRTYMVAGKATTTLMVVNPQIYSLGLQLVIGASSTLPRLNYSYEVSNDNIDWFSVANTLNTTSTTTPISGYGNFEITMTSTSTDAYLAGSSYTTGAGIGGTASTSYWFVKTPQIQVNGVYTRVIITSPIGNKPIDLWARAVPLINTTLK